MKQIGGGIAFAFVASFLISLVNSTPLSSGIFTSISSRS